jgi:peptidoglycan/LPS O-acetylase OafA/YrhL
MSESGISSGDERFLATGDEAGTSPGDRAWRPDVEGLRAIAVTLVVFVHYGVPRFAGGYVGVDVFFVISGYVITGLLLRERLGTGRTSLANFYARRSRRILPAALLVILVMVLATYLVSGIRFGNEVAGEGRWAAAFGFNFRYFFPSWNPLPILSNFWSLAVEEQFYIVFPVFFFLVAKIKRGSFFRAHLAIGLAAVIITSYTMSIMQSSADQGWAFVSPVTRAWELALGALISVGTPWLLGIPKLIAAALTWLGMGVILFSAVVYTELNAVAFGPLTNGYPGWRVAVPVVGAGMVIAGGTVTPRWGVEPVIGTMPFRWLGRRSYSLYLWHWPIFVVASQAAGSSSLWKVKVPALVISLVLTVVTYRFVEEPFRHWRLPSGRTVRLGLGASAATVLLLTIVIVTI